MIPLGLCSVVAIAVLAERLWFYSKVGREQGRVVEEILRVDPPNSEALLAACCDSDAPIARVINAGIAQGNPPSLAAAERQGADEARRLEGWLPAVDAVVTLAPLLGLLGTIIGMMQSFKALDISGSAAPHVVTGGIAQALITTAAGLVIAVVAFAGYSWCRHVMERELHRTEQVVGDVLERLVSP